MSGCQLGGCRGYEYAGINWEDIGELSDAGINWEDVDVMSEAGVNWVRCGEIK